HRCQDSVPVCLLFFFFQAEDGIRDATVTGVQTCALPISPSPAHLRQRPLPCEGEAVSSSVEIIASSTSPRAARGSVRFPEIVRRSEERRVGKECRSRWSGSDARKKQMTEITGTQNKCRNS